MIKEVILKKFGKQLFFLTLMNLMLLNLPAQKYDTLRLYYHFSQTDLPDSNKAKVDKFIAKLNNQPTDVSVLGYYQKNEFKNLAVDRTNLVHECLRGKARLIFTFGTISTQKVSDASKLHIIDIIYKPTGTEAEEPASKKKKENSAKTEKEGKDPEAEKKKKEAEKLKEDAEKMKKEAERLAKEAEKLEKDVNKKEEAAKQEEAEKKKKEADKKEKELEQKKKELEKEMQELEKKKKELEQEEKAPEKKKEEKEKKGKDKNKTPETTASNDENAENSKNPFDGKGKTKAK